MTATIALPRRQLHSDFLARLRTVGLGLGGRGVMGLGLGRSSVQAAEASWWLAGGIAAGSAVAVYQPKGAASLAASYTNLANPGTYDAAPGTAPTWNGADGWVFNGGWMGAHLLTGVAAGAGMTMVVRFSGAIYPLPWWPMMGSKLSEPSLAIWATGSDTVSYAAGGSVSVSPALEAGVLAVAGQQGYRNGVADGGTISTAAGAWGTLRIGALGDYNWTFSGAIQAVAIYNTTLTAGEVAAASAAMAAL